MPKPDDRGSLMNLKANLPKVAPIEPTDEMERRIMGSPEKERVVPVQVGKVLTEDVSTYVNESVKSSLEGAANLRGVIIPRPRREGTVLMNAKIPASLHTRLKRTSQYNEVSMTDILLRAIEVELISGRYSVPPDTWGND